MLNWYNMYEIYENGGLNLNKAKYKIILLYFLIIVANIIILSFSISLYYKQTKSEEVFNYYINENILNEPDTLYVTIKNTNDEKDKIDKEILEENYQTGIEDYYIKVNYEAQTVTIYAKDENGYYTNPIKAIICSTGTDTPQKGIYQITDFKKEWLTLYGGVYGQYCTQIVGNILFHSVPYFENENPASLEYLEYDKLGQPASLGCVRLKTEDAKWIFDNCKSGTMVEFYASENPGPLGKPKVKKISNYEELRNWDPTDEKDENPWKLYLEQERKKTENLKQVVTTIKQLTSYMKINN